MITIDHLRRSIKKGLVDEVKVMPAVGGWQVWILTQGESRVLATRNCAARLFSTPFQAVKLLMDQLGKQGGIIVEMLEIDAGQEPGEIWKGSEAPFMAFLREKVERSRAARAPSLSLDEANADMAHFMAAMLERR